MGIMTEERIGMLSYTIPELYERHHAKDPLTIEEYHVAVGEIVQPDQLLLTLGTPHGFCEIHAPIEELSVPHQVTFLPTPPDGLLHLGDLLVSFKPVSTSEAQ